MSNEQVTPEQYKARLLKQNFANRCADYEDVIAALQTQVAMLQQQVQQLQPETETSVDDAVVDGETNQLPPPPEPPAE